jgi:hypothetical protein
MFKLAVPLDKDLELNDAETLIGLRAKYPNCYFKTGMLKDQATLFVLANLTCREYGPPKKLKDSSTFYPPLTDLDISEYEVSKDARKFKIEVTLSNSKKLWVKPATLEPQVYSLFDDTEDVSNYSQATEYGKLAYSIYDDIVKDKDIKLSDERVKKFIKLLIQASYAMPLVIFDALNIISVSDLMPLISAGLGIDEGALEVKKNT